MQARPFVLLSLCLLLAAAILIQIPEPIPNNQVQAEEVPEAVQQQVLATYGELPLYFIENQGQLNPRVAYYIQDGDKSIYFTGRGVTFALTAAATGSPAVLLWSNPGPGGGSDLMSIALHPTDSNIFYLSGDIEGPLKTIDGGQSYFHITRGLAGTDSPADTYAGQEITLDPSNAETLYLATGNGLFKSTDAGQAWSLIDPPAFDPAVDARPFASVAVSPFDPNIVLAGVGDNFNNEEGQSTIRRSTDGGVTFSNATTNLARTGSVVHRIVFDTVTAGVVYAATGEGVLKSSDDGATWTLTKTGLPAGSGGAPIVHDLTGINNGGTFLLFATLRTQSTTSFDAGGVFRSGDGGATWQNITGNLPTLGPDSHLSYNYWRLAVDPGNPNVLYVATRPGVEWAWDQMGVFQTTNALDSDPAHVTYAWLWDEANFPTTFVDLGWLAPPWSNDKHAGFLAVAPFNPSIVLAGGDQVYRSTDGGVTWSEVYSQSLAALNTFRGRSGLELMEVFDVAVHPTSPDIWWVGYDDMGLWRTDDGGQTFVRMDGAQDFDPAHPGAPVNTTDCACNVVVDPSDPALLYVGRSGGDSDSVYDWDLGFIYKSTDGGANWTQLGVNQLQGGRPQILMLPSGTPTTRVLLVAIYGQGLFRSTDSGSTWRQVDTAFTAADRAHIWSLAFDPSNPNTVYAGITDGSPAGNPFDGGIYKSADGGQTWGKLRGATVPTSQILGLDVASDGTVYAATTSLYSFLEPGTGTHQGGLYRSADGGDSWTRVLDQPRVEDVSVRPGDPTQVVAAVSSFYNFLAGIEPGVYVSQDSGLSFQRALNNLPHTFFWFIKYHSTATDKVFAGTHGGGLYLFSVAPDFPLPTVSSISPANAPARSLGFPLTVHGSGFTAGSLLRWNGSDRPTAFVSSTELRASILASDLATADTAQVAVLNPPPGGGTSNAVTFTITAPPPLINPGGIVNGASFRAATDPNGAIAPGTIVSIFGTDLADSTALATDVPLPTTLGDTNVTFNGIPAPLFFVSAGQINAQVPFDLPTGTVSIRVKRGAAFRREQSATVAPFSPGIFTLNAKGTGAGAILHADTFELVSESNPARPGEFLAIFCTGLGAVEPEVPSGQVAPSTEPLARTLSPPQVNIAGIPATVSFSGAAPTFVGLYQVNVQVPMGVPSGTQELQIIINGVPSNTVTLAVE